MKNEFKVLEGGKGKTGGFSEADLRAVEVRFHDLIRERARDFGGLDVSSPDLPRLTADLVDKPYPDGQREWYAVRGMSGGFAWSLSVASGTLTLDAESWSRVLDGFGQHHRITPTETVLLEDNII